MRNLPGATRCENSAAMAHSAKLRSSMALLSATILSCGLKNAPPSRADKVISMPSHHPLRLATEKSEAE